MVDILMATYDPNDKNVNQVADDERKLRGDMITLMWRYYNGDHHRPLKVRPGGGDDNIIVNLVKRATRRALDFIKLPDRLELPGEGELTEQAGELVNADQPDQVALNALYERWRRSLNEVVLTGWLTGHVFIKLSVDDTGSLEWSLLDPRYVTVFTDVRNPRRVLFYRMLWTIGKASYMQDTLPIANAPEAIRGSAPPEAGWVIIEYQKKGSRWEQIAADYWLHPFAPILDWANSSIPHVYYGVSEIGEDGVRMNNAVNFVDSNTGKIIKHHAHPKTVVSGASANQLQATAVDGLWTLPSDANVFNLEMQSDLQSSMKFGDQRRADFYAQLRVLDLTTVKDRIGQITNFGVRMLYDDMVEMANDKRSRYGDGFAELFRRLMTMSGFEIATPACIWPELLPMNRLEQLQAAQIENGLGITSKQTLATYLGRDYVAEQEKRREEQRTSGEMLADLLTQTGEGGGFA